jgi:hypothetical protein
LKSPRPDAPRLSSTHAEELTLSNAALIGLMGAVLERGRSFRFRARGSSMYPFIREGDVITVSPLSAELPAVGEVVACLHPRSGNLVVHRVVARTGVGCIIRGDSIAIGPDGLVERRSMLGKVTRVERHGGITRLGMGPERVVIAALSQRGLLWPLVLRTHRLFHPLVRRMRS